MTVRSEEKGQRLLSSLTDSIAKRVSYVVVKDIAQDGAFDKVYNRRRHSCTDGIIKLLIQKRQAVQSVPPFDFVVHTASPYHFNVQDPVKDFLDPAIKGTTGILRSVKEYAPSVGRVVITSSSAAMINPANHPKVYNESCWAAVTWEEAMEPQNSYRASKASLGSFPLPR